MTEVSGRRFLFVTLFVGLCAVAGPAGATRRSFLYREANLALGYSFAASEVRSSPLPVGSSVGLEYVHSRSALARGKVGLAGVDLHLRASDPDGPDSIDFYFQDAWALFRVGGGRSQLRVGHFNVPFGINPVMEPRGIFRMPLEALDLGMKKDWGLSWQRAVGGYDVEAGAFLGMGGDLHWRRGSEVFAARVGTPTFREFEYGLSLLVGDTPMTMGDLRMSDMQIRRVRTGLDTIYLYGNHTIFKGELSAGTDDGRTVVGGLFTVDWVPPRYQRWSLGLQIDGLRRNMPFDVSDAVRTTLEVSASIGDTSLIRADLVRVMSSPMGESTDLYLLVHHYGR